MVFIYVKKNVISMEIIGKWMIFIFVFEILDFLFLIWDFIFKKVSFWK